MNYSNCIPMYFKVVPTWPLATQSWANYLTSLSLSFLTANGDYKQTVMRIQSGNTPKMLNLALARSKCSVSISYFNYVYRCQLTFPG